MLPESLNVVATLLTAIVGFLIAFSIRRKNDADAAVSITSASKNVLIMYETQITALQAQVKHLQCYMAYMHNYMELLVTFIPETRRKRLPELESFDAYVETDSK